MLKITLIFLVLFFITDAATAQPPLPSTILTHTAQGEAYPIIDHFQRKLYVYQAGAWVGLPYPVGDISPFSISGDYVLFHGYRNETAPAGDIMQFWHFYSYNTRTRAFVDIGEIPPDYELSDFEGWLTPTLFVIYASDMPEWSSRDIYVGDVTTANSLHNTISKTRFYPQRIIEPAGFQNMLTDMDDGFAPRPCTVMIYDAATQTTQEYHTGSLCDYGISIPDGSGDFLYRAVVPDVAVVRHHHVTGARRTLFIGEVERLLSVSPDGRYALVEISDDGVINLEQDDDAEWAYDSVPPSVMDLRDGSIIGRVPVGAQWLTPSILYLPVEAGADIAFTIREHEIQSVQLSGEAVR